MLRQIRIVSIIMITMSCLLSVATDAFAAQLRGEKFGIPTESGFTLLKVTVAGDFSLYELKLNGRAVAKIYEGDNPDFPYNKAVGKPRKIASGTTVLSTPRTNRGNFFKRDFLVEFSDCESLCAIHVWYDGLTLNIASEVDSLVDRIRRNRK